MTLSTGAVRGDTKRVVRRIQKIRTCHLKSVLKPGPVLKGIMPSESCFCAFKGALDTVETKDYTWHWPQKSEARPAS